MTPRKPGWYWAIDLWKIRSQLVSKGSGMVQFHIEDVEPEPIHLMRHFPGELKARDHLFVMKTGSGATYSPEQFRFINRIRIKRRHTVSIGP
jgi:hypothetical protein